MTGKGILPEPAIYEGSLYHRRRTPVVHQFRYRLFMVLLDIDRIEETLGRSRLSSRNRFNWASFYDEDHFGDPAVPLRERLQIDAARHGLALPDGPVYLLTQLRYLGYCFNPVSFYYCFNQSHNLELVVAEVNNTFGETTNYWLHQGNRVGEGSSQSFRRHRTGKHLHVSPFMGMDMQYEFALDTPAETLNTRIRNFSQGDECCFDASLQLDRVRWTAGAFRRILIRYPWTTMKTISAIHYEAARLFLKRAPFFPHPGNKADAEIVEAPGTK